MRSLAVATFVALCGCGQTTATTPPSPLATPSTEAGATVPEDLTFTGALSGRLTSGSPGDAYICTGSGGSFVAGPILGSVAGRQVELNIVKPSFTGAGTYSPGGVSFDVGSDHYYPVTGAPGSLVIGSDVQSGTVDIDLAINTDPNHAVAHVRGAWRCPPGDG